MSTKFILHGGESGKESKNNENFFREILNSVHSKSVKILCIYFARPQHRWEDSFDEDKQLFRTANTEKEIEFQVGVLEIKELKNQILQADIIFINGGMKGVLRETLLALGDFSELIKDKIVVGISAGANILSKYYYSSVANGIREGIGILQIKVLTHWNWDLSDQFEELYSHKERLPIYKIEEERFVVFEKD